MYREQAQVGAPLWIVAFNGKVFALERLTGKIVWRLEMTFSGGCVELVMDRDLVVACDTERMAFINYADGNVRRVVDRKDVARRSRPVVLVDEGHLLVGGSGEVACYTRDGELLWDEGFAGDGYGSVALGVPGNVRQADANT